MIYCKKCVLPDTRPNIKFNSEGVCDACKNNNIKQDIDWSKREQVFRKIVDSVKVKSKGYDCIIPVSGGKDSTWQVVTCLKYGLNPLAVTWKTPARTKIGQENLTNLINLGVDHIDYQINPKVEKKFLYKSLFKYGSTAVSMHMGIYNLPLKLAVKFDIPLVIWGENSAFEYGGDYDETKGFKVDSIWLKKYGVTHGTTAEDWLSQGFTEKELAPYFKPSDEEIDSKGISAIFLGYYFQWDPENSLKIAKKHGFKVRQEGSKTGYYNYADIDDDFISIHHWLKWYKFGFTRLYDNLSLEIRNGRMTREQAIEIIKQRGDETPYDDIEKFCGFIGITKNHFFEICEKFRNKNIWINKDVTWMIKDFLIKDWKWK